MTTALSKLQQWLQECRRPAVSRWLSVVADHGKGEKVRELFHVALGGPRLGLFHFHGRMRWIWTSSLLWGGGDQTDDGGPMEKGLVSYRSPGGPAGRRGVGWSAQPWPAWRSPRWGRWSKPRHCTGHWDCKRWERHLAGAAQRDERIRSQGIHAAAPLQHQGEPTKPRGTNCPRKLIKPVHSKREEKQSACWSLDLKPTHKLNHDVKHDDWPC